MSSYVPGLVIRFWCFLNTFFNLIFIMILTIETIVFFLTLPRFFDLFCFVRGRGMKIERLNLWLLSVDLTTYQHTENV